MGSLKMWKACAAVALSAIVASGCSSKSETATDKGAAADKAATTTSAQQPVTQGAGTQQPGAPKSATPGAAGTNQPGQMVALKHAFHRVRGSKDFPGSSTKHNIPEAPGKPPVDLNKVSRGKNNTEWKNTTKAEFGQKHCPSFVKPEELGLKPEETAVAWGEFYIESCSFLTKDTFVKVSYSSMRQWLTPYPYGVDPSLAATVSPADKVGFQAQQVRRANGVAEDGVMCTIALREAEKAGFGPADSPKIVVGTHETKEGKFTSKQLLTCRDHMMITIDVFAMNEDGLKAVPDANMQAVANNLPAKALPRLKEFEAASRS